MAEHALEQFKLMVISEDFSDREVASVFGDIVIEKEEDVNDIFKFLQAHRPKLLEKLNEAFSGARRTA